MKKPRYRSGFERTFHQSHPTLDYEPTRFKYTTDHTYTPDFYDSASDTYFETKGRFTAADRSKILRVLEQNPDLKLVLVFQNPNVKLSKSSKTTYGEWSTKHGIEWCSGITSKRIS